MTSPQKFEFPDGKRFAFTIVDDTDVATVANVKPMYDLLHDLGLRATKTVWPVACPEGSRDFSSSQTLEDPDYRAFAVDLQRRGFEVTWHGATMETSPRARTIAGLQRFNEIFGAYPRIHLNHAYNRENVYWGDGTSRFAHAPSSRRWVRGYARRILYGPRRRLTLLVGRSLREACCIRAQSHDQRHQHRSL